MAQPFGRKNILENLKAIFFVSHCELRAKTATWLSAYVVDSDDYVNLYANCYSRRAELRFRSFCHSVCIITVLLLIYDAVHNAMTSQECSKNPYCMVVSHACIHAPLVRSQAKPKIVRCVTGNLAARNMASQPSICRLHYPHHRSKHSLCH